MSTDAPNRPEEEEEDEAVCSCQADRLSVPEQVCDPRLDLKNVLLSLPVGGISPLLGVSCSERAAGFFLLLI